MSAILNRAGNRAVTEAALPDGGLYLVHPGMAACRTGLSDPAALPTRPDGADLPFHDITGEACERFQFSVWRWHLPTCVLPLLHRKMSTRRRHRHRPNPTTRNLLLTT